MPRYKRGRMTTAAKRDKKRNSRHRASNPDVILPHDAPDLHGVEPKACASTGLKNHSVTPGDISRGGITRVDCTSNSRNPDQAQKAASNSKTSAIPTSPSAPSKDVTDGSEETVHHKHSGQTIVPDPLTLAECEVFSGVVSEAQPGVNMATDGDDSSRHSNFSSRTRDSNYMYRSSTISNKDENSREAYQYQSGDEGEFDGRQRTRKELRMLNFKNPGKFMDNFDPERSSREMRKMNRRIYKENLRKNQMYDEYGRYLDDLRDICDCLVDDCDGCFFPCTKCKSTKCGIDCRINRRYVYDQLEIEGSRIVKNFPDFQEQSCFYK